MKKFGILPEKSIDGGYKPYHETLEDAKRSAYQISKACATNVVVFEVIGEYEIKTIWSETE
jgi:hypothetical protein